MLNESLANSYSYFLHQTQVTAALSESQQHDQDHLTTGPSRVSPGKHHPIATWGVPLCTVPEWIDGGLGTSGSPKLFILVPFQVVFHHRPKRMHNA